MSQRVELACKCGTVQGNVEVVSGAFFHAHCLCIDCQNVAKHLNNEEAILDEHGGSEVFQTYPAYLKITAGHDSIGCFKFNPKGLCRWYTTCCNMPLANTMSSASIPFVGVSIKLMQFSSEQEKLAVLGPVSIKAFGKYAKGPMPKDAYLKFPLSFMPKILAFMFKGMLFKKNTPSPFFNNKQPIVVAEVISGA